MFLLRNRQRAAGRRQPTVQDDVADLVGQGKAPAGGRELGTYEDEVTARTVIEQPRAYRVAGLQVVPARRCSELLAGLRLDTQLAGELAHRDAPTLARLGELTPQADHRPACRRTAARDRVGVALGRAAIALEFVGDDVQCPLQRSRLLLDVGLARQQGGSEVHLDVIVDALLQRVRRPRNQYAVERSRVVNASARDALGKRRAERELARGVRAS